MRFDWWTFALQTINFVVLVALLWRFLYRPVGRTIARRKAETEKTLAEAAAATQRAETAQKSYEAQQAEWATERARLLAEARRQIESERAQSLEKTRGEAEATLRATREELAQERAQLSAAIRSGAVELALELAARLLHDAASPAVAELLLQRLNDRLGQLPRDELAKLRAQVSDGDQLEVVTAPPLDADAEARWRRRLSDQLGARAHIHFACDERLIAGAELHFPNTVIGLSWRQALDGAREELRGDALT